MKRNLFASLRAVLSIGLFAGMATALFSATANASQSAGDEFSPSANPNGTWSYGYKVSSEAPLSLFDNGSASARGIAGMYGWNASTIASEPHIYFNSTASAISFANTVTVPPRTIQMHPGPNGELAVLRWTAPAAGTYAIQGSFRGNDAAAANRIATIRRNNVEVFGAGVGGLGSELPFALSATLAIGDTLDFAVDPAGAHQNDSTGLTLNIGPATTPSGSIVIPAASFVNGQNVAVGAAACEGGIYGATVLLNAPPCLNQAQAAEFVFGADAGQYRLIAEYAALTARPVRLKINNVLVKPSALEDMTGCWFENCQQWIDQGVFNLTQGQNVLRVERDGYFPHMRTFRFEPISQINGTCGTANGVAVATAPTANLCATGTANPATLTGPGPWLWLCDGSGSGRAASCSAPIVRSGGYSPTITRTLASVYQGQGWIWLYYIPSIEAAAGGIASYRARCAIPGGGVYELNGTDTPFKFTSVTPGITYNCYISALTSSGGVVSSSDVVTASTGTTRVLTQPDIVKVEQNKPRQITVLQNDGLSTGDRPGQVESIGAPSFGAAVKVVNPNGTEDIRYTPNAGYAGPDSFTYVARDERTGATASGTVYVVVQAPLALGANVGATVSPRVDVPGGGNTQVLLSRVDSTTLKIDGFNRTNGSSGTGSAASQTFGHTIPEGNQFSLDAVQIGSAIAVSQRYETYSTPSGDLYLKDVVETPSEDESMLGDVLSAVGDALKTGVESVGVLTSYTNFWEEYSRGGAKALATASRKTAQAVMATAAMEIDAIVQAVIDDDYALFKPPPDGSSDARFPSGAISLSSNLLVGSGKVNGMIDRALRHDFFYAADFASKLSEIAGGADLVETVWDTVDVFKASVALGDFYKEARNAYREFGKRRVLSNINRYVRAVPDSGLHISSQTRSAILKDMQKQALLKGILGSFEAFLSGNAASKTAGDVSMNLLKLALENDLHSQLLDVEGRTVLLQDLLVEKLAQDPLRRKTFLCMLPTMDVWTYETSGWIFKELRRTKTPVLGKHRYDELIGKAGESCAP